MVVTHAISIGIWRMCVIGENKNRKLVGNG